MFVLTHRIGLLLNFNTQTPPLNRNYYTNPVCHGLHHSRSDCLVWRVAGDNGCGSRTRGGCDDACAMEYVDCE
jgi:hypothetical protein